MGHEQRNQAQTIAEQMPKVDLAWLQHVVWRTTKIPCGVQNSIPDTLSLMNSVNPTSLPLRSANQETGSTAVIEKEQLRVRKPSPRYKVLLHNDPVNSMEYVVATLRHVVPSLSEQDAIAVMLEAHNTGIGLVIVCDIEPAEFYSETLKAKGLTSTIEPED